MNKKIIFFFALFIYIFSFNGAFATQTFNLWSNSDKNPNVVISGAGLIASGNGNLNNWNPFRGNLGVSSGKWYWEETLTTMNLHATFGVGNINASLSDGAIVGGDCNAWGYTTYQGFYYHCGPDHLLSSAPIQGDIIGLALDMDNGTLTFYRNGQLQGTVSGISGTVYPMSNVWSNSVITANFGQSNFSYDVPSGFNVGFYTGSVDVVSNTGILTDTGTIVTYKTNNIFKESDIREIALYEIVFVLLGIIFYNTVLIWQNW